MTMKKYSEQINFNTQILSTTKVDPEKLLIGSPSKVRLRVTINSGRLNSLATTVVAPDCVPTLTYEDLEKFLTFSNQINSQIGLPATDSLILRSAYAATNLLSEPAMLARNLLKQKPVFKLLSGKENSTLKSLEDFTSSLRVNTFLIIHDDNYELQTGGVHVRTLETESLTEILFGTNCLQAREMEMEEKRVPSIRISMGNDQVNSHMKMGRVFDLSESVVSQTIDQPDKSGLIADMQVRLLNVDRETALNLCRVIRKNKDALMEVHEVGQEIKGQNAVVETRIYGCLPRGVGRRVQVLDID